MQTDYREERRWKIASCYELAGWVLDYHLAPSKEARLALEVKRREPLAEGERELGWEVEEMSADRADDIVMEEKRAGSPSADVHDRVEEDEIMLEQDVQGLPARVPSSEATLASSTSPAAAAIAADAAEAAETVSALLDELEAEPEADLDAEGDDDADGENDAEGEVEIEGELVSDALDQVVEDTTVATVGVDSLTSIGPASSSSLALSAPLAPNAATGASALVAAPITGAASLAPIPVVRIEGGGEAMLIDQLEPPFDTPVVRRSILDLPSTATRYNPDEIFSAATASMIVTTAFDGPVPEGELEPTLDADMLSLLNLFPEWPLYTAPASPTASKTDRRIDESSSGAGKLTHVSRLLDFKPVLVSTLQPGKKFRPNGWSDVSDLFPDRGDVPEPRYDGQTTNCGTYSSFIIASGVC